MMFELKPSCRISVVTPVYGCRSALFELFLRLKTTLEAITPDFEIIMVNDGSPDGAWDTIVELAQADRRVRGINLSRNFGQHQAITAGLDYCHGEWVVVMDCDLQDQPEEVAKLYNKAQEGYEIVFGRRLTRHDNFLKKSLSKVFYSFFSYLTETKQDSSIANFGIYHRKVIDSVLKMQDSLRYFPTMVRWVGFRSTAIEVGHAQRRLGKTSYNFKKLLLLAVNTIISFSEKPLRLTIKLGLFISFLSLLFGIYILYRYFHGDIQVIGWPSVILSLWFLAGIIIFILGIVGLYIGKTFERTKNRPLYIVTEKTNIDE